MKLQLLSYLGQPIQICWTVQQANEFLDTVEHEVFRRYTITEVDLANIALALKLAEEKMDVMTDMSTPVFLQTIVDVAPAFVNHNGKDEFPKKASAALLALLEIAGNHGLERMFEILAARGWRDDLPSPLQTTIPEVLEANWGEVLALFGKKERVK